jgi:coenzyme F420-reducing hydrogenase beta subunit
MALEKPQWKELFSEVVTSGLCTGCAACVIACPHPVLDYETDNGVYKPFHLDIDGGPDDCTHGQKGCTMCTRACPRFRNWESEIDTHKFARERTDDEVWGIGDVLLARATDESLVENGQDGGFVSALLIYALENDVIDAALVSGLEGDGSTWRAVPQVARTRADVIETAKSRYTYSANLLAYPEAAEGGAERIALVGMGCMASAPGAMQSRKAGKLARRLCLTIGLMCSKTFDDSIFEELFEAKYGIKRADIFEDEHQGCLPDLDDRRQLPRSAVERGSRLHPRRLQAVSRLRRGTRRHLDRRNRRLRRLDARHRAHRSGPRIDERDEGEGLDRDPTRRRRPRRGRAVAQARDRVAQTLARGRGPGTAPHPSRPQLSDR